MLVETSQKDGLTNQEVISNFVILKISKVDFKIVEGTNHFSLLDHAMSEDYELNKKIIEFIQNQQRFK